MVFKLKKQEGASTPVSAYSYVLYEDDKPVGLVKRFEVVIDADRPFPTVKLTTYEKGSYEERVETYVCAEIEITASALPAELTNRTVDVTVKP